MGVVAALATRNSEFYAERVFDPDAIAAMRPSLRPMAWPWLMSPASCTAILSPTIF